MVRSKLVRCTVGIAALVLAGAALSACVVGTGISGKITSGGTGQAGITIAVFDATDDATPIRTVVTGSGGNYALTDLTAGTYHVRIADTSWYDGSPTANPGATPTAVAIAANQVKTINVDTAFASGALGGSLVDQDSNVIEGATIDAISAVDRATVVATTTTNAAGTYQFPAGILPVGTYVLRASKAGYGTVWGHGSPTPADASTVVVTDGGSAVEPLAFTGADATLDVTVTNGHTPIAGSNVAVYLDERTSAAERLVATARVGADGTASFPGLNRITYRLLVLPPAPYKPAAYGTQSNPDVAKSTVIDLTGGSTSVTPRVSVCDPGTSTLDLTRRDFTDTDLRGCDLSRAVLSNATLTGADIDGADLSSATLNGVRSGRMRGVPKALRTGWRYLGGYLVGPRANLPNSNPEHASLVNAHLDGMDLLFTNFAGSDLHDIDLSGANIQYTNLQGVDLRGADLRGAILDNADITDADLTGAKVAGMASTGIVGTPAQMDPTWRIVNGGLLAPGVDLRMTDNSGADWSGADLAGANLEGISLQSTYAAVANFRGANLRGVEFFLSDLTNADLTDADLTGAYDGFRLARTSFNGVTWSNTTCPDGSNSSDRTPESCTVY